MDAPLWILTFAFAITDWLAVEFSWRRVEYAAKPLTLIALIAWFTIALGWKGALLWFGLGLVFSLLGDVCLMFGGRMFLPGLISFLLAHVAYIAGFNQTPLPLDPLELLFLAGVLGLDFWLFRKLLSTPAGRGMAYPVAVYMAAIDLMALSALVCLLRPEWSRAGAWMVGVGALLFLFSDSLLAYNRFVAPTRHGGLLVMASYHLAQIGIVLGLALK